ncbi:MAG: amidohydrolase family protein [Armatimonadota bacterium]
MEDLRFFDAHCYVGRYKTLRAGSFYTAEDLLDQMRHFGIAEALVTHSMSRELHPVDGNCAIIDLTRSVDNLYPCWSLLPPRSREMPAPAALVDEMVSSGVRAARLFYGMYSFPISEWCIGELLDELEKHRVPTFLDPDVELDTWAEDRTDWDAVHALCEKHPQLPIVLSQARFRSSNRLLYQLLERHANLHIEISGLWAHHAVEFISREFGANRLLFGTRMPVRDPACAIGQVAYADISEKDKRLIAGDNLRALMGGVAS